MKNKIDKLEWEENLPDMPERFLRRIQVTCETLPEKKTRLPLRAVAAATAVCLAAALMVFFGIGTPGENPDMLTPLTQSTAATEPEQIGNGSENIDPAFIHEEYSPTEMQDIYAQMWPFENTVYDNDGPLFDGTVYLHEDSFDPYYHVDPEKCAAGTKDGMIKTIRQTAYRMYKRELCLTCAPQRDLELLVWVNEGSACYHMEQACGNETMQVYTTLEKAVTTYGATSLCPYCSGIVREGDAESSTDFIIDISRYTYEITLNEEWARRQVHLADDGVYHYNSHCGAGKLEPMSQLQAVRDHKAVPCSECMGDYMRRLVVYHNDGDTVYHALSLCNGNQFSKKVFQYQAMDKGLTICPDCFANY